MVAIPFGIYLNPMRNGCVRGHVSRGQSNSDWHIANPLGFVIFFDLLIQRELQ